MQIYIENVSICMRIYFDIKYQKLMTVIFDAGRLICGHVSSFNLKFNLKTVEHAEH